MARFYEFTISLRKLMQIHLHRLKTDYRKSPTRRMRSVNLDLHAKVRMPDQCPDTATEDRASRKLFPIDDCSRAPNVYVERWPR